MQQAQSHNPHDRATIRSIARHAKTPTLKQLERWLAHGYARTPTCNCKVEVDGICAHGRKSWLTILGLI